MENFDDFDIFGASAETVAEVYKTADKKPNIYYTPDPAKGKDGVYSSIIKFVYNPANPKEKSIVRKYSNWLIDPISGNGFSVDCPTTIGEKSLCQDIFFKYRKSESAAEKKAAEMFSRKENYYSIIQVIRDDQNPEAVGKFFIFKFGKKIHQMVMDELEPEFGEKNNIFDPIKGKMFHLKVTIQNKFKNYDTSKFVGEGTACLLEDGKTKVTMENADKFKEYWKKACPDMKIADFKPWDDDTIAKVNDVIKASFASYTADRASAPQKLSKTLSVETTTSAAKINSAPAVDEAALDLAGLDLDGGSDDDDDDLYANL